ncbi:uncharacterized protein LOC118764386 [Octopus sinensis]|uniref:Uncharacterized protein LOC118764386 n=1 Tax=Octopus sinensis TaxID=2607531 RepID=A0A7E6F0G1_9MOLL|nr:uncharacterized protein LOC118764386 [Octopus sinensis]
MHYEARLVFLICYLERKFEVECAVHPSPRRVGAIPDEASTICRKSAVHYAKIFEGGFTLLIFGAPITGRAEYKESDFKRLTKSKCLSDKNEITEKTASGAQCGLLCTAHAQCGYFSYCNGACHLHRPFYSEELEDYTCNSSLYILLNENGKHWQKVFEITKNSFERSPIYLYWDILPIKKVEFQLSRPNKTYSLIFNGTGTNSTSWFREDKLISHPLASGTPMKFTFNNNFSMPYFRIDWGITGEFGWMEAQNKNGNYEIKYKTKNKTENRQKVFKMTEKTFYKSPIYLYWDSLPIEKVKLWFSKSDIRYVYTFNGTGTNSTSWCHIDKFIDHTFTSGTPTKFTFNNNFREPHFRVDFQAASSTGGGWMEAQKKSGTHEIYWQREKGKKTYLTHMAVSVILK